MSKVVLKSRFPQIVAELNPRMDIATKTTAEAIAEDAKSRAPALTGALRDAIHVERSKLAEYRVVAGNTEVFYGHMVEHGTSHSPPHPFLVPAAEAQRPALESAARAALQGL